MLSTRRAIDIAFIALVIVAILITVTVVARALTNSFSVSLDSAQQARTENFEGETNESGDSSLTVTTRDAAQMLVAENPADQISSAIYGSSHFLLPITWGAVAGTLIWRGKIRSAWSRQGYDYDTFKLVAKMRGSPLRIRLLNAVSHDAKNKLQLAKELEVDWKTVDNHVEMLLHGRLVQERTVVGTARYYAITHDGMKVLSLLSGDNKVDGGN